MLDLSLAIGHHLLIFAIFGIICAEFWAVRPGMSEAAAARIASLDLWYGVLAAAILAVGFCRAVRKYLHLELGLFFLLPVFAAAMARGYGQF
jgi:uncharacterized membrane protein